jgi:DNA-binding response OmpR family regulator
MNLGADDYITKPVAKADLLAAIRSRLERAIQLSLPRIKPNFHSAVQLEEEALGSPAAYRSARRLIGPP